MYNCIFLVKLYLTDQIFDAARELKKTVITEIPKNIHKIRKSCFHNTVLVLMA